MIVVLLALVLATICIQIPNLLGMAAVDSNNLTVLTASKISLITLPVSFVATTCFTLFYGKGHLYLSYPSLSVIAKAAALLVAFVVQVLWLHSRETGAVEMVGISIALIGTTTALFHKEIELLLAVN